MGSRHVPCGLLALLPTILPVTSIRETHLGAVTMAIPGFQNITLPFLALTADGAEHTISDKSLFAFR
jgi:hypothetical protein